MGKIRGSPEKALQRSIIEWLWVAYPSIKCWLQPSIGRFDSQKGSFLKRSKYNLIGISDIVGLFPNGMALAIEVKVKPNKCTPEQVEYLAMINDRGGLGVVVYSLEDVERAIKTALKFRPHLMGY